MSAISIQQINELICRTWDPTGVYRQFGDSDEYIDISKRTQQLIQSGATSDNLRAFFYYIQEKEMGLKPDKFGIMMLVKALDALV